MAVEYFNMSVQQRSKAQSATAKSAYNSCCAITDERTGVSYDYSKKSGLVHSEIIFPEGMPQEERGELWNRIEKSESRINSCVSRSFEIALPLELTQTQRTALAQDYARQLSARYDVPVDFAIHEPTKRKPGADAQAENPHTHMQIPDRNRAGEKLRELSKKDSGEVVALRQLWEETCNRHLAKAGSTAQITMKKKPPLPERKLENENALGKIDRQIAALERAIQRLERRGLEPDSGNRDNGPRIEAQGAEQLLSGREHKDSQPTDRSMDKAGGNRFPKLAPLPYRQYQQNGNGNLPDSQVGRRDDHGERGTKQRPDGIGSESPRLGSLVPEPCTKDFSLAVAKLKEKLEALKAERNIRGMEEQNHDREQSGTVAANVQAVENRALERAEITARTKERITQSRGQEDRQGRNSPCPQNQSGPVGSSGPRM